MKEKVSSGSAVKDIRRRTRTKYSSEEKIRIVLEDIRRKESIASLYRHEGRPNNYSSGNPQNVTTTHTSL
jgi:transposase